VKKKLNLIVICADTWRGDYLGCNGNTWVKTPCLDQLAAEGVLFTNVYADGLPTIPMRRVFFTGNSILPLERRGELKGSHPSGEGWYPLKPEDVTLPEILQENGYLTALITDCFHYFKPEMNFHRFFNSWEWIRGQERDFWRSGPRDKFDPKKHMPKHHWNPTYDDRMRQYLMNTADRQTEEDFFCAQCCRAAMRWLEQNYRQQPFFLWLDMFDPHEPWDAPRRFQEMYCKKIPFERYLFGYGIKPSDVRPSEYPLLRGLYAAEVTFSDLWIGHLLDKIRSLGLMDDTVIIFSTDHGTHLGEEGCIQKHASLLNSAVANLPLIVRHPSGKFRGKRVSALVSGVDYMPSMLALLGIKGPKTDGKNFWDLVTGKKRRIHDRVFVGYGNFGAVRDLRWHYFQNIAGDNKGKGPALYDLKKDPGEKRNVAKKHPDVVEKMRRLLEERFGEAPRT